MSKSLNRNGNTAPEMWSFRHALPARPGAPSTDLNVSGVIVRTAAAGASEDQLREDLERLLNAGRGHETHPRDFIRIHTF
jgi:hypothetical protein